MNKNKEIWKTVIINNEKFPYYEVSNKGNIRSVTRIVKRSDGKTQTIKGKLLSKKSKRDGYIIVKLKQYVDQKPIKYISAELSRIVASTFIDNKNNYPQVHHVDYNKENNSVQNLEWVTNKYNHNDMQKHYNIYKGSHSKNIWDSKTKEYKHPCKRCNKLIGIKHQYCKDCIKYIRNDNYGKLSKISIYNILKQIQNNNINLSKVGRIFGVTSKAIENRLKKEGYPYKHSELKQLFNQTDNISTDKT